MLKKMFDPRKGLQARMFYVLAISQLIGNTVGAVSNAILHGVDVPVITSGIFLLMTLIVVYISMKTEREDRGSIILTAMMGVFQFPLLLVLVGYATIPYFILVLAITAIIYTGDSKRRYLFWMGIAAYSILILQVDKINPYIMMTFSVPTCVVSFLQTSCTLFYMMLIVKKQYEIQNESIENDARILEKQNEELEISRLEAQEANRAKTIFLANMSHEIRTPINSVIGMNEMILRESNEQDIRNYALNARQSAKLLLGLINDILDFSKIESGKMEISCAAYKTGEVISDVMNMIASRANDKGLTLSLNADPDMPSELYGDDVRLRQIITNLLTNAVKYTKSGSVTVNAGGSVCDDGGYMLRISIADTGIGIKHEDMEQLFNAFQRVDKAETRTIEGTGLGLNITSRLLNLMGTRLEVKSVYGEGSEFSFSVMQKIVDPAPVGKIEITGENRDNFTYSVSFTAPDSKILVVDDNDMNRIVFRSLLKQTKINITDAASGRECLELIAKERFDIIFLDHMMPVMDGIETFHRIKEENNLCKDVPVIVLTANAVSGAREAYMEQGFTDFLSKPISYVQLEKMAMTYLPEELVKSSAVKEDKDNSQLPEIEGFNFDIARLYSNDDEMIRLSLEAFGDNLVRSIALLGHYLPIVGDSDEDLDLFRIQAHSLKGTAAIVGAMQVSELAKTAEFAAKSGDLGRINAITPIVIEEARACLERLINSGAYSKKPPCPDRGMITEMTEKLIALNEEFMVDEADALMDELYGYSFPEEIQPQIELLKIASVNCDGDSMKEILEKIRKLTPQEKAQKK